MKLKKKEKMRLKSKVKSRKAHTKKTKVNKCCRSQLKTGKGVVYHPRGKEDKFSDKSFKKKIKK